MNATSLIAPLALLALVACDDPCADADGDGAAASAECTKDMPVDCDDTDASVHPDAVETCNGVDDDCDGLVDEEAIDALTVYADADADGYGDASSASLACDESDGWVEDATDCDDGNAAVNPGALEACNQVDDDCDGLVDMEDTEVVGTITVYVDADGDGYGEASSEGWEACTPADGESLNADDCDDEDNSVSPGATEVCDDLDVDEDCDGLADDEDASTDPSSFGTWYPDADADGYGDATAPATLSCEPPAGHVDNASDCDDADDQRPAVIPCYEGTWSLEDAIIRLEFDSLVYNCVGDVLLDIDSAGEIDGSDLSCLVSGLKDLPYELYGSFTTASLCEGSLDFGSAGGPAYDFDGELTTDGTLLIEVDQAIEDVHVLVDWELEQD